MMFRLHPPLLVALFLMAVSAAVPMRAQDLPGISDEVLARARGALRVDVQTGRVAGVTRGGPVAEVGAKIVDVLFGDYVAGEWIGYTEGGFATLRTDLARVRAGQAEKAGR